MARWTAFGTLVAVTLSAGEALAVAGGGFSLTIRDRAEDGSGYVRMAHGTAYAVCFRNDLNRRADAELSIDGLPMGTWRLGPYRQACIERPAEETGRFTFYRADSAEGYAVGSGQVARPDKGRVSVRFIPEIERYAPPPPPVVVAPPPPMPYAYEQRDAAPAARDEGMADSFAAPSAQGAYPTRRRATPESGLGAGVTGLSGQSDQRFRTARAIERDWADAVTLELRLVHDPAYDPPVQPRPLPGRYDRYAPPPVGY